MVSAGQLCQPSSRWLPFPSPVSPRVPYAAQSVFSGRDSGVWSHDVEENGPTARTAPLPNNAHSPLRILSNLRPFASSSTNLSRYLTCCVNGLSMSSTRWPQITPVIR